MKKALLAIVTAICFTHVNGQAGTLDPNFGAQGVIIPNYPGYSIVLAAVVVQPDGKLVAVGRATSSGKDFASVLRYNSNGTPDNMFSEDGLALIDFGRNSAAADVAIQADGKIVVVGSCNNFTNDIAVGRLRPDGTLDNSFSQDGILETDFSYRYDVGRKVTIQTDGKIVVLGVTTISIFGPWGIGYAIARYNPDGSLDNSYSGDGKSEHVFSPNDAPRSLALQADGKLVMSGTWNYGNYQGITHFLVARLNSNGSGDYTFNNGNAYVTIDFDGNRDYANDMSLQADGKMLVAGSSGNTTNGSDLALARLNSDGTADNAFSADGKITIDLGSNYEELTTVVVQSNGKIIAGGYISYDNVSSDVVIVRLDPNGTLDNSFSGNGIVVSNFGSSDYLTDLAIGNDRLYAIASNRIAAYFLENAAGTLTCPSNRTVNTDLGVCTAVVNFLEPTGVSTDASLSYTLDGATVGSGTGSASGRTFNKGVTTVTYNSANPAGTCQFTVTVNDKEAPKAEYPVMQQFCYSAPISVPPLVATDNCGIQSITYTITGATTRSGTGTDVTGDFNPGDNYITWTIYDLSGNVKWVNAIIKVNRPLLLNIPDAVALNNGVDLNTVYPGYEPASKLTLQALASGGSSSYYTYKWSNGAATRSITVSPQVPATYSVTVTDEAGCTKTESKFVNVIDVRCGNNLNKVLVCKVPKGNPSNAHSICISASDVRDHLNNGSYLGECKTNITTANRTSEPAFEKVNGRMLTASPNPSTNSFNLVFKSESQLQGELVVWDAVGKQIERRMVMPNTTIQIGSAYKPGQYVVQVVQGGIWSTLKLVKL